MNDIRLCLRSNIYQSSRKSRHVECNKDARETPHLKAHVRAGAQRPAHEMASLPAINLVVRSLSNELVAAKLGQDDGPENPVNTTAGDDTPADNAVQVVGQGFVDCIAVCWGHERCDHEVDVAEEEEDRDGQSGAERRVPAVLVAVGVEPDEAEGDEGVNDRQRVRDDAV